MELLLKTEERYYPTDYLLSRVRGRRRKYRGLIADESPEGIWGRLLKEYQWVYLQMNRYLQVIFQPFFIYSELRTIILCLRHKAGGEKIDDLLTFSLLSDRFKGFLKEDLGIEAVIKGIEDVFLTISSKFEGLVSVFARDGLRGVEQKLVDACLEHSMDLKPHTVMRDFFAYLIDRRNIINLYKHLRWGIPDCPSFVAGGCIKEESLIRIFRKQDISALLTLIRGRTGISIRSHDATDIERSLLEGLTVFLRRSRRDPLCIGVILDYLWLCYMETINQGVILHGRGLERKIIEMEMIH